MPALKKNMLNVLIVQKYHLPKAAVETKALIWAAEQHGRPNGKFEVFKVMCVFMLLSYRRSAT